MNVFAGKCLSQRDIGRDKQKTVSDLATSAPTATSANRPTSQRDTMGRLEPSRACVSDEFADVTAAAFTARPSSPENRLPRALRALAPYLLPGCYPLSAARRANHPRQATFPSTTTANRPDQSQKATSPIYVATERSEGGSQSLRSSGTALRAREGEAA